MWCIHINEYEYVCLFVSLSVCVLAFVCLGVSMALRVHAMYWSMCVLVHVCEFEFVLCFFRLEFYNILPHG